MNPHGFGAMAIFGALCLVLLIGCAAGLLMGLVGMALEKLASWSGGLLNRPRRLKLVFSGDRKSRTIKLGKWLRKIVPGLVKIMLWDGYHSRIYLERR